MDSRLIKVSKVICELPLGINLPDGSYPVNTDTDSVVIVLTRIKKETPVGIPKGVKIADGVVIKGDRWGRLFHTGVTIIYNHDNPKPYDVMLEFELRKKSIDIINKLLKIYCIVTTDPIPHLSESDLFSEQFKHYDADENEVPGMVMAIGTGGATIRFGPSADVNPEHLVRIKNLLDKNYQISIEDELLINAKNEWFYDNFRIAVIEAETAFEVFIDEYIAKKYREKGISTLKIENILKAGLENLLEDHVKKLSGYDFKNSNEYQEWKEKAYSIRNGIVHDGKSTNKPEAWNAIQSVSKTIHFIRTLSTI